MKKNLLLGLAVLGQLLLLVMFLSGCMKNPKFEQDFGPQNSEQEIKSTLDELKAESGHSVEARPLEVLSVDTFNKIESYEPYLIRQEALSILCRNDYDTHFVLRLDHAVRELHDGQMKLSTSVEDVAVKYPSNSLNQILSVNFSPPSAFDFLNNLKFSISTREMKASSNKVTYHRLRKERRNVLLPEAVRSSENCGGLNPQYCRTGIPALVVGFDQVVWSGDFGEKTSLFVVVSKEVPYLSRFLQQCVEKNIKIDNQMAHVLQCAQVADFKKGSNSSLPCPSPPPVPSPTPSPTPAML